MQFFFLLVPLFLSFSQISCSLPQFEQKPDISQFNDTFKRNMETLKGFIDDKQEIPLDAFLSSCMDSKDLKKIDSFPLIEKTEIMGVKRDWSLASLAAERDCPGAIKVLKKHGINIYQPLNIIRFSKIVSWMDPLAIALIKEHRAVIELLYKDLKEKPHDVRKKNCGVASYESVLYGPMAFAVKYNKRKSMEILIELGEKFSTPSVQYINSRGLLKQKSTSEWFFNTIDSVPGEDGFMLSEDEEEEEKEKTSRRRAHCLEVAVQHYHNRFLSRFTEV